MIKNNAKTFPEIVDVIGGTPSKLESLLQAYDDFNEYFAPLFTGTNEAGGGRPNEKEMSKFVNANSGSVSAALETFIDENPKLQFAKWIKQGKIESAADDVRKIPTVLNNDVSREAFYQIEILKLKMH